MNGFNFSALEYESMSQSGKMIKCQFQLYPEWVEWDSYDLLVQMWNTGLSELKLNFKRRFQMFRK